MSYIVQFSPVARDQLGDIEDYIAEAGSPDTAARYVDATVSYCVSLADFPLRGRRRDDLMPGLRITNYRGRTVVAFVVDEPAGTVSIVGVFYGGQDYESRCPGTPND
ncbi:MAG: type II toxin-antitoxin system RelE/ParE family toxin (plasmid) [Burkholderia sp.]